MDDLFMPWSCEFRCVTSWSWDRSMLLPGFASKGCEAGLKVDRPTLAMEGTELSSMVNRRVNSEERSSLICCLLVLKARLLVD